MSDVIGTIEVRSALDGTALDDARALVREHVASHSQAHDPAEIDALVATLPEPYVAGGGLWVGYVDGAPAGCVALFAIEPNVAELKRMFVSPKHRGRGVARTLAEHVIAEARQRGCASLRLGTLTTMHAAQRLYTSLGFRPIPAYRSVEFGVTLFYELAL